MLRTLHRNFFLYLATFLFASIPLGVTHAQIGGSVNLLYEAESYTPDFYRGRSLPSANVPIRVFVDANLVNANGSRVSPSNISYTWSVGGRVMQNISGVGKNYLVLAGPPLFGASIVGVEVTSPSGQSASRTVRIGAEEPILALYENSPLTGISLHNALSETDTLSDRKTTVVAEPYFFSKPTSRGDIKYTWRINNTLAAANPGTPNATTISSTSTNGLLVSVSAENTTNALQKVIRSWSLFFASASASQFTKE